MCRARQYYLYDTESLLVLRPRGYDDPDYLLYLFTLYTRVIEEPYYEYSDHRGIRTGNMKNDSMTVSYFMFVSWVKLYTPR